MLRRDFSLTATRLLFSTRWTGSGRKRKDSGIKVCLDTMNTMNYVYMCLRFESQLCLICCVGCIYHNTQHHGIAVPLSQRSPRIAQLEERSTVIVICHRKVTCSIQVSGITFCQD